MNEFFVLLKLYACVMSWPKMNAGNASMPKLAISSFPSFEEWSIIVSFAPGNSCCFIVFIFSLVLQRRQPSITVKDTGASYLNSHLDFLVFGLIQLPICPSFWQSASTEQIGFRVAFFSSCGADMGFIFKKKTRIRAKIINIDKVSIIFLLIFTGCFSPIG